MDHEVRRQIEDKVRSELELLRGTAGLTLKVFRRLNSTVRYGLVVLGATCFSLVALTGSVVPHLSVIGKDFPFHAILAISSGLLALLCGAICMYQFDALDDDFEEVVMLMTHGESGEREEKKELKKKISGKISSILFWLPSLVFSLLLATSMLAAMWAYMDVLQ